MSSLDKSISIVRHYCHKCNEELDVITTGQTCPVCQTGFIEEMSHSSGASSSVKVENSAGSAAPADES